MSCTIDGCVKKEHAKGWCGTHYARWRRRGSPTTVWKTLAEKFESHVKNVKTCWEWVGALDGKGYGHMRVDGHHARAHRVGWFLKHGTWPKELDHLCRNKICVNPEHLEPVTHADNIRRANIPRNKYGRYTK